MQSTPVGPGLELALVQLPGRMRRALGLFRKITGLTAVWLIHVRFSRRSPRAHSHTCPIGLRCSVGPIHFDGQLVGLARLVSVPRPARRIAAAGPVARVGHSGTVPRGGFYTPAGRRQISGRPLDPAPIRVYM